MDREERKNVFFETVRISNKGRYTNSNGEEIIISRENDGIPLDSATLYDKEVTISKDWEKLCKDTEIEVVNGDCLYEAKKLYDEGLRPAVLNMASFVKPGGGVIGGSAAQEENICRRTNLFESIFRFRSDLAKEFGLIASKEQYPLDMNFGAVYSPSITVFRASEDRGYELLDAPFQIDVISVAAIKCPKLQNGDMTLYDKNITKNKIRTILNLGIIWENESLVLGALGCGAYRTPPNIMAKLFHDVLSESLYKGQFKKIVFAVLDDGNSHGEHHPEGNFIPFKREFEKK